jgi:DnaJ-class molecular chaperone
MDTTIPQNELCETCFGKGTLTTMKTPKWGHPIDLSQPICPTCKGKGRKPEVSEDVVQRI